MIVNSFGLLGRFIVEFRFFFFQALLAVAGIDVGIGGIMLNFMFGRGDGIFQVVVFQQKVVFLGGQFVEASTLRVFCDVNAFIGYQGAIHHAAG